jgi:Asp/Glu/hydantoin racemase
MRILVVNPNTTVAMTETIGRAARAAATPGTEIVAVNPPDGPVSIEGYYDEAFSVPGLLAEIAKRDALGCAGMADLAARLSEQHGLPVVDGVASAIKLAEALGALGLKTSKIGSYAAPRPKAYLGSFASFAPR